MKFIKERLHEASTWRGIIAFVTGIGVVLGPEQSNAIIAGGLGFMGIIGAFTKDKPEVKE